MGESIKHIMLVYKLIEKVNDLIPNNTTNIIIVDLPDRSEKPPCTLDGNRPDLYYCYNDLLIIGEAKTSCDFDRRHSIEQYLSYMRTCFYFDGTSYMVLAVPWTEYISAKNLLKRLRRQYNYNVRIEVINDLGRSEEI